MDKAFKERILIQMTKAIRLLEQEGYNPLVLNPMRQVTDLLRYEMNVQRVKTDAGEEVIYNKQ